MPTKRMLSAAIPILLAASLAAPIGARALSDAGFEYTVTSGTATVTGCTSTCPTNLVIPDTLGGYAVTSIGTYAFSLSGLTSLILPNTLLSIADYAFEANPLTTVSIPDSVETIGIGAFYRNSLTSLQLGNSLTTIGLAAFSEDVWSLGENSISSLVIPNSVTFIGDNAFAGNAISLLLIPDSVTSVGNLAFAANTLTSVCFFGNAPVAGGGVFDQNSGLLEIGRIAGTTGWGATWSEVPVGTCALPPTNRDGSTLSLMFVILAGLTVAASIGLRARGAKRA